LWIGVASNEKCQSKPHSLKNKSPQNLEEQKDKQEKVEARKAKPKQNAIYDKLEKNMNEKTSKKNKELNEKEGTQKIPKEKH